MLLDLDADKRQGAWGTRHATTADSGTAAGPTAQDHDQKDTFPFHFGIFSTTRPPARHDQTCGLVADAAKCFLVAIITAFIALIIFASAAVQL